MTKSCQPDQLDAQGNDRALARGDDLARTDDWVKALEQWRLALDGPDAADASRRIRWFIHETSSGEDDSGSDRNRRGLAYRAFLAATIVSGIGTAVTLVGIGKSGTESTIIAAAAWVCFAIAIALSLVFARLLGSDSPQEPVLTPGDHSVTAALHFATTLDQTGSLDDQVVHRSPNPVRKWPRRQTSVRT